MAHVINMLCRMQCALAGTEEVSIAMSTLSHTHTLPCTLHCSSMYYAQYFFNRFFRGQQPVTIATQHCTGKLERAHAGDRTRDLPLKSERWKLKNCDSTLYREVVKNWRKGTSTLVWFIYEDLRCVPSTYLLTVMGSFAKFSALVILPGYRGLGDQLRQLASYGSSQKRGIRGKLLGVTGQRIFVWTTTVRGESVIESSCLRMRKVSSQGARESYLQGVNKAPWEHTKDQRNALSL